MVAEHFQGSNEDADSFNLGTAAAGVTAANLALNGAGASAVVTPDNYTQRIAQLILTNVTASALVATVQITNGTVTYTLATLNVGANASETLDEYHFRLLAPSGFNFQVVSTVAASLNANARARFTKGGS